LNEIRGLKFDYLFIAGLNDGDLPTRFTPEIFFSGSFAKEEVRHQVEERYLFYQALCTWNKGLYLTYPLFDEKKELVQSSFLKDFADLFEVRDKDSSAYEDAVYSKEELLEKIGEVPSEKIQDFKVEGIDIESIIRRKEIDSLRRDDPFGNSEFTGGVGNDLPEVAKSKLNEITNNQFSATQLENYAKCPYKFFVENILKLETIEEPKEELEAFEFGSLIHSILYEFYTSLNGRNIVLQNCTDEEFAIAEKLMFKIAEEKFNALHLNSEVAFYEREKLLGINRQRRNSLLYKFLEAERKNEEGRQDPALSGYIPSFFEIGFGKVKQEPVSQVQNKPEIIAGNVKVKGKIDRIDINKADKTYKVIDYKLSGTKPTIEDLTTGISLQLPLYLFAAKELIKTQLVDVYKPAGAEIFSLKYSEEDFGKERISIVRKTKNEKTEDKIKSAEEMIEICIEMINKYVQSILEGKFNLSKLKNRENKVCRYCDFRKICRIQEVS
jgi:ATP-dependent helicase/nuclease subunit B